jgi:hypothetical protein
MASIDVLVVSGHTGHVVESGGLWQPVCFCGWKGPKYPSNDHGTAQTGLDAHCLNANDGEPLESHFFTELTCTTPLSRAAVAQHRRKPVRWRGL